MKKKEQKGILKRVVALLIVLLMCLVSFFGIYKRDLNGWKNVLPDYEVSKELTGSRNFSFVVDDSTEEQEIAQESSEETQETTEEAETETETEKTPETTEVPVNKEEDLNLKNYEKARTIIEQRVKEFGILDSTISLDEKTGSINVEVPNDTNSDYLVDLVTKQGKFEIVDSDTEEVLMDSSMVKSAAAFYAPDESATADSPLYNLGVTIEFNSAGEKKLNEISKTYIETTNADGEVTQKTVTIRIDGEDKRITYFAPDSNYTNLNLSLYQSVDLNDEDLFNEDYRQCLIYQTILETDKLPITYVADSSPYFESNYGRNEIIIIAIVGIVVGVVIVAAMIKKFGKKAVNVIALELGYVALLLFLIRYAGVAITLTSLLMIIFMSLINYLLTLMILNEDLFEGLKKFVINMIPLFITIIVFVFSKDINISSVGMVGFWGIVTFIFTGVFSLLLLDERNGN